MMPVKKYNPNDIGKTNNNIFGFPFTKDNAQIILIPVPWDVTASYRAGASEGPDAILNASPQLDFYDPFFKNAWKTGIFMEKIPEYWKNKNKELRKKSELYIDKLANGGDFKSNPQLVKIKNEINDWSKKLNEWVKEQSLKYLDKNKLVGIVGGEHSVSLGLINALSKKYNSFGILQVDAHADLRIAYEGFEFSHASSMNNALKCKEVKKLVQVSVRDYCEDEAETIKDSKGRISCFTDEEIKSELYKGKTWNSICEKIVSRLPENVYLSFDVDGLNPSLCPNTGTPVPGGMKFEQAIFLLNKIVEANKKIIGFDLCEVAPGKNNDWDGNVGARLVFRICNFMAKSMRRKIN
ncbi:MAG: agmatinase family protein [Bacteroidales bacterium]|nr:agmatinase family protein [Bacteroidales bacterium]